MTAAPDSFAGSAGPRDREAWSRFLARMVDALFVLAMTLVVAVGAVVVAYLISTERGDAFSALLEGGGIPGTIVNSAALVICIVLYDTLLIGRFGTTPGKRVMGILITTAEGGRLGTKRAFKRSLLVVTIGLGLEIPVVTAATRLAAYFRLQDRAEPFGTNASGRSCRSDPWPSGDGRSASWPGRLRWRWPAPPCSGAWRGKPKHQASRTPLIVT